eukprot:4664476-Lingulodinium_polyedra.AAC.1
MRRPFEPFHASVHAFRTRVNGNSAWRVRWVIASPWSLPSPLPMPSQHIASPSQRSTSRVVAITARAS